MAVRDNIPPELLDAVKNYINVTWSDEATDKNIGGLIASGMVYLRSKLGADEEFLEDGIPRSLLFDYVRYMRDGALDIFESNYRSLIITAINERRVQRYEQEVANQANP